PSSSPSGSIASPALTWALRAASSARRAASSSGNGGGGWKTQPPPRAAEITALASQRCGAQGTRTLTMDAQQGIGEVQRGDNTPSPPRAGCPPRTGPTGRGLPPA